MGVIYKLTSPSGKSYIGQTKQPFNRRWNSHTRSARIRSNHCIALERAIRKYGPDNFKKEILLECDDSMLNHFEEKMVKAYGSNIHELGYNLTSGGDHGQTFNKSTRLKMSKSHRNKHGNDLPKYLIKTGCKKAGKSGYQITNHPKCKRKRFTGEIKDDAKSLRRALNYLEKLETDFTPIKETLPRYVSYLKSINGYSVQIPRSGQPNLRKQFASKRMPKEQRKQKAIDQLNAWKLEYNIE